MATLEAAVRESAATSATDRKAFFDALGALRDTMNDLAGEMRAARANVCPSPGKCVELAGTQPEIFRRLGALELSKEYAKGAIWGIGALGGLVGGVAALLVTAALKLWNPHP